MELQPSDSLSDKYSISQRNWTWNKWPFSLSLKSRPDNNPPFFELPNEICSLTHRALKVISPPSLLYETTVVAYTESNLPLVLEQWVWVGLNTVIYDFALAAHRQAYHKRLQWCIGKLDREIRTVHMFLFEHYSIRPERETDPWTERTWPVICPRSLLGPYLLLWKMKRLILNTRATKEPDMQCFIINTTVEGGGKKTRLYTLPFKVWGQNCLMSLKEVSYAHQGRIYLIKNTVKNIYFKI